MSMIDTTKAVAFALSLGLVAGAAVAQDTTQPAQTETPAAEAPATTPAAQAETPASAQPADGPGSVYLKGTEGDWEMRCIRVEAGQTEPCQMYQLLKDDKGNSVAEISVFPLATGQKAVTGATVSVPLETLLTDNLVIQVDSGKPRIYPYTWCDRQSCVARVGFTAEDLAALKGGNKATMTIVPVIAPDQKVNLSISLKGFTKSYDSMPVPAAQ